MMRRAKNNIIYKSRKITRFWFGIILILIIGMYSQHTIGATVNTFEIHTNYAVKSSYTLSINGTQYPLNITFWNVPAFNYSTSLSGINDENTVTESVYLINATTNQRDNGEYNYLATVSLYNPEKVESNLLVYPIIIDPFELGEYYFRDYDKIIDLFNNNNTNITYEDVLGNWGPNSVITFIFDKESKILPLIGPIEISYYYELKDEGSTIKNKLLEMSTTKLDVKMNWDYSGNADDVNISSVLIMNSELSFEIDAETYNASIYCNTYLRMNGNKVEFFTFNNRIEFFDKNQNTTVGINYQLGINAEIIELDTNTNGSNTQQATIYVAEVIAPLFLLGVIAFNKKRFT